MSPTDTLIMKIVVFVLMAGTIIGAVTVDRWVSNMESESWWMKSTVGGLAGATAASVLLMFGGGIFFLLFA